MNKWVGCGIQKLGRMQAFFTCGTVQHIGEVKPSAH